MTNRLSIIKNSLVAGSVLLVLASCQKDAAVTTATTTAATTAKTVSQTTVATLRAIAVGVSTASKVSAADSIYVIGACDVNHHTDSIAFSTLAASITAYLATNYDGFIAEKAFADKDSTGTITGYVVIIEFNGKPVGLKFDATGTFVKVLEQREGHDLVGPGWHNGGCFDDRGGDKHDSVIIADLPLTITVFFTNNYAADTLIHAFIDRDSSYVIISINNGAYATIFTASGAFVKRIPLQDAHDGNFNGVMESQLLATITTYLNTTYPDYVFKQAFKINKNGTDTGYVVIIDANATKYAVEFTASGAFVKATTLL